MLEDDVRFLRNAGYHSPSGTERRLRTLYLSTKLLWWLHISLSYLFISLNHISSYLSIISLYHISSYLHIVSLHISLSYLFISLYHISSYLSIISLHISLSYLFISLYHISSYLSIISLHISISCLFISLYHISSYLYIVSLHIYHISSYLSIISLHISLSYLFISLYHISSYLSIISLHISLSCLFISLYHISSYLSIISLHISLSFVCSFSRRGDILWRLSKFKICFILGLCLSVCLSISVFCRRRELKGLRFFRIRTSVTNFVNSLKCLREFMLCSSQNMEEAYFAETLINFHTLHSTTFHTRVQTGPKLKQFQFTQLQAFEQFLKNGLKMK